jgi:hypothetical protein
MAQVNVPQQGPASTLDEPVMDTIMRDLKAIGRKTLVAMIPPLGGAHELRDWDLWGPLIFCMILAVVLGQSASSGQGSLLFASVFMLIWAGSGVVTLNAKFLGAHVSFFQSVCVMGYCIAPMCITSLISLLIVGSAWIARLIMAVISFTWSTYAALRFFRGCVKPEREGLVLFPLALLYFFITWMIAVGA